MEPQMAALITYTPRSTNAPTTIHVNIFRASLTFSLFHCAVTNLNPANTMKKTISIAPY